MVRPGQCAGDSGPLAPFRTMRPMSAIATRQSALVSPRTLIWLLHVALPMIGLWLLIARPEFDLTWEDHAAHFWLVLVTAAVNVGLALVVGEAAYRRSDAPALSRVADVPVRGRLPCSPRARHAEGHPRGCQCRVRDRDPDRRLHRRPVRPRVRRRMVAADRARTILRLRPILTGGIFILLGVWLLASFGRRRRSSTSPYRSRRSRARSRRSPSSASSSTASRRSATTGSTGAGRRWFRSASSPRSSCSPSRWSRSPRAAPGTPRGGNGTCC